MIKFITIKTMFYPTIITKIFFTCLGNRNFTMNKCHFYNGLDRNSTICLATALLSEPAISMFTRWVPMYPSGRSTTLKSIINLAPKVFLGALLPLNCWLCHLSPFFFRICLFLLHITTFLFYHWIIYIKSSLNIKKYDNLNQNIDWLKFWL